jgi:hypothetical protein
MSRGSGYSKQFRSVSIKQQLCFLDHFVSNLNIKRPFALSSIDNIDYSGSTATFSITVRKEGNIEFSLIQQGKEAVVLYNNDLSRGMHEVSIDLSDVGPGFYHVIMYNDKRVAHFQEINRE